MKRLFMVALAVLLVLCVLHADETHFLTVSAAVQYKKVIPVFRFEFTSGMMDEEDAYVVTVTGDEMPSGDSGHRQVVFVDDIKHNDLELVFTARLANTARCRNAYTLTFVAGDFNVVRDGESGVLAPSFYAVSVADDFVNRTGVHVGKMTIDSIQLDFNGSWCTMGDLATFEVRYEADSELDPATYYTDISLEVSSDY